MNCPKCSAMMDPEEDAGLKLRRCDMCRGLWCGLLEKDRLKGIADLQDVQIGEARVGMSFDSVTDFTCPRCRAKMVSMIDLDQPQVHYEACTACGGVFFDAGEFRDLKSETPIDFFRRLLSGRKR